MESPIHAGYHRKSWTDATPTLPSSAASSRTTNENP